MTSLSVMPEAAETNVLGKLVSSLQEGVTIEDNAATGTLMYVTGYTGYSSNPEKQSGNYIALKVESDAGAVVTALLENGETETPVTLDEDMNLVVRIADIETQKSITFTAEVEGKEKRTLILDISSLECEASSAEE